MSSIFRLRYYLRRSGEKQPLLLLEPILTSATSESFWEPQDDNPGQPSPTFAIEEKGFRQWFIYSEGGDCEAIELRKIQALCQSRDAQQQLLHELRREALSDKSPEALKEELSGLWQASVKGIALRQLEQGQLIASEGVWLLSERSYYALLPCSSNLWQKLRDCNAEQRVEFCERGTQHVTSGLLAVVEQFAYDDAAGSTAEQMVLCRLRLDRRILATMQQVMPLSLHSSLSRSSSNLLSNQSSVSEHQLEKGAVSSLYGIRFAEDSGSITASQMKNQLGDEAQESDIFLFAPVNSVESSFALRKFLLTQLPLLIQKGQMTEVSSRNPNNSGSQTGQRHLLEGLQDLAADFIGWGEYHSRKDESGLWIRLGGWCLKRNLLQKYASYIYQRACQFGGYRIEAILKELDTGLPSSLLKSLLTYLCANKSGQWERSEDTALEVSEPNELELEPFRSSCCKVDGYLLAQEMMHPALRRNKPQLVSGTCTEAAPDLEKAGEPSHISPQGRKLLQDLYDAGEQGLALYHLQRELEEVLKSLLRSGWAIVPQAESSRCYARGFGGSSENPEASQAHTKNQALDDGDDQELGLILAHYKEKNKVRNIANGRTTYDWKSDSSYQESSYDQSNYGHRNHRDRVENYQERFSKAANYRQNDRRPHGQNHGENSEHNHRVRDGEANSHHTRYHKQENRAAWESTPRGDGRNDNRQSRSGGRYSAPGFAPSRQEARQDFRRPRGNQYDQRPDHSRRFQNDNGYNRDYRGRGEGRDNRGPEYQGHAGSREGNYPQRERHYPNYEGRDTRNTQSYRQGNEESHVSARHPSNHNQRNHSRGSWHQDGRNDGSDRWHRNGAPPFSKRSQEGPRQAAYGYGERNGSGENRHRGAQWSQNSGNRDRNVHFGNDRSGAPHSYQQAQPYPNSDDRRPRSSQPRQPHQDDYQRSYPRSYLGNGGRSPKVFRSANQSSRQSPRPTAGPRSSGQFRRKDN